MSLLLTWPLIVLEGVLTVVSLLLTIAFLVSGKGAEKLWAVMFGALSLFTGALFVTLLVLSVMVNPLLRNLVAKLRPLL